MCGVDCHRASSARSSSSPYDAAFKQHLIDHQVWPIDYYFKNNKIPPKPDNLQDIIREIKGKVNGGRKSLEPSSFTPTTFRRLQKAYRTSTSKEVRSRALDTVKGEVLSLSSSHQRPRSTRRQTLRKDEGQRPDSLGRRGHRGLLSTGTCYRAG